MSSNDHTRYFIELAYHGQAYHGWQIQQNAPSVQEVVDKTLSTITRETVSTVGCGRTDTGVHARQLFAHFDLKHRILNNERFLHQVNSLLPENIVARGIFEVPNETHARFDAIKRSYEYHIHFDKNPFLTNLSWQIRAVPDVQKMNKAARILQEYRDFTCFSKSNTQVFTNNCTVFEADWQLFQDKEGFQKLVFFISADRFLRNMVRAIVGTLLEIGAGKQPVEHIRKVIESKNRSVAGASVPASGLYLTKVEYDYSKTLLNTNPKI